MNASLSGSNAGKTGFVLPCRAYYDSIKHMSTALCPTFVHKDEFRGSVMIKCHLARMMGERKMKMIDVARHTGIHRNTVAQLYKETAQRIDLDVIEKLCILFECQVGDILEYVPSES